MKLIKFYLPNGSYANTTQAEQFKITWQAFMELYWVADLKFQRVFKKYQANLRFEFRPQSNMPRGAFGYAKGKDVLLNSTRIVSYRYKVSNIIHEISAHYFGLGHSKDRHCANHAHLGKYMCSSEAIGLQRKVGKPKAVFYPQDLRDLEVEINQLKGKQLELLLPFNKYKAQDEWVHAWPLWLELIPVNQTLTSKTKKWYSLRDEWSKVPMMLK
jgi:hypothetical protein